MRPLRILRALILTILLALIAFIQVQQHLLRHRAERLHAEIVALQLHPGTFADIQRLQTEWGRYAHYEGECTPHHCIYEIDLTDWATKGGKRKINSMWPFLLYATLGGRPVLVGATVAVRDARMSRENFVLGVFVLPFQDPRSYSYLLFTDLHGGPHLFRNDEEWYGEALKLGYRDGFEGTCTGCEGANIYVTSHTNKDDVSWLTELTFSCITRLWPCRTEYELLPKAWQRHHDYEFRAPGEPDTPSDKQNVGVASIEALGREAPEAVLIRTIKPVQIYQDDPRELGVQALVLQQLKASTISPGRLINLLPGPIVGESQDLPIPGQQYILAFWDTGSQPVSLDRGIDVKAYIPATASNLSAFRAGAAQDIPLGEPDR